ncbi:hypothetical protein ZIOFF_003034 [Zingiber officinale]|uniref:non-specific serine/threonine protein kinase n=1 Tax=Zingiber officinale TaxID=94328 RepID=A0A8J5LZH5_ZINOF|nr:hypothetical protein ZIOFF_003034 [Zingiber officinale]
MGAEKTTLSAVTSRKISSNSPKPYPGSFAVLLRSSLLLPPSLMILPRLDTMNLKHSLISPPSKDLRVTSLRSEGDLVLASPGSPDPKWSWRFPRSHPRSFLLGPGKKMMKDWKGVQDESRRRHRGGDGLRQEHLHASRDVKETRCDALNKLAWLLPSWLSKASLYQRRVRAAIGALDEIEDHKVVTQLRKFTFNELKSATRNFGPESLFGEGGFGCVFKGWIEESGTAPVKPDTELTDAFKTLNHDGLQWLDEVNYLGQIQHPNLVKLIGYCIEDDQRLLVYEFMPRGKPDTELIDAFKTLNHDGLQWLDEVNYLGQIQHPNLVKLIGYCIEDDKRLLVSPSSAMVYSNAALSIGVLHLVLTLEVIPLLEDPKMIKRQELDITPRILIMTRLLPDAVGLLADRDLGRFLEPSTLTFFESRLEVRMELFAIGSPVLKCGLTWRPTLTSQTSWQEQMNLRTMTALTMSCSCS